MLPAKRRMSNYDRLKIADQLDEGKAVVDVAKEHAITPSGISRIRKTKSQLREIALSEDAKSLCRKKSLKTTSFPDVENALLMWLHQKRQLGHPISGPVLCAKALIFNEKLNGPKNFKASHGWLEKFKKRHGMQQPVLKGEKLSSNPEAAETFKDNFKKYITENGYTLENLYNADETGLNWCSLPHKTLAPGDENEDPGGERDKERVTVMFCCNATGSHRIPAYIIGKSKRPRCFEGVVRLPVMYKTQTQAWMNRFLFMEWYVECFIPAVKEKQHETGRVEKVLLLLDNALSHPSADELNTVDENFQVLYLPPNVTPLIQPMDQGVIDATKRIYRRSLARRLLLSDYETPVVHFMEAISLKDCCEMIGNAWEEVTVSSLQKAWNNLIKVDTPIEAVAPEITDEALQATLNAIPGISVSTSEINTWIHEDDTIETSEQLDDDQIVDFIIRNKVDENQNDVNIVEKIEIGASEIDPLRILPTAQDAATAIDPLRILPTAQDAATAIDPLRILPTAEDASTAIDPLRILPTAQDGATAIDPLRILPTAQDAATAIDTVYAWFEMQPESTTNDLLILNKIRDLATCKAMGW